MEDPVKIDKEVRWLLIESFLKEKGLAKQHLDSYNEFVTSGVKKIVKELGRIDIAHQKIYMEVLDIRVGEPEVREIEGAVIRGLENLNPTIARIRNLTYSAPMFLKIVIHEDGFEYIEDNVPLGYLPVMIRSVLDPTSRLSKEELIKYEEDWRDPGGYFIINGSERVIVGQEDLAPNRVFVDYGKEASSITHTAKVISASAGYRVPIILDRLKDGTLVINFPSIPQKVPFAVMMRALGLETDMEIALAVSPDPEIQKELIPSLYAAREIKKHVEALDYLASRVTIGITDPDARRNRVLQILDLYFMPHLGNTPNARILKALYLGQMACKLIELMLGRRKPDDKDHYANRRLRLAGDLLAQLFRVAFKAYVKDLRYQIERYRLTKGRRLSLKALARPDIITERLNYALATGNWVGNRTGVSQILDRTNWISMLSHLRRTVAPLSRGQPHFEARDLHPTQWGRICPFETPEGPNCGLVKNLALSAYVTAGIDESLILPYLQELGMIPLLEAYERLRKGDEELAEAIPNYAKIFLNGTLIGYYPGEDASELVRSLRKLRRSGKLHHEVNIYYGRSEYINEVHVNCDSGRVRRPLLILEEGKLKISGEVVEKLRAGKLSFSDLVSMGVVEYLDAEEEDNSLIALDPEDAGKEHTHLELYSPSILGVAAVLIPYGNHNQSPRNAYEAAMAKQAVGLNAANFHLRFDSRAHFLHYPQKPVVQTRFLDLIGFNSRPAGQNFVVAILSFTGYNMEDAVIMNKSSVERGLARSTFFREYSTEELRYPGGQRDMIGIPDIKVKGYRGKENYEYLDGDGIIPPEVDVTSGRVLVGKTSPPRFLEEYKEFGLASETRRDSSVSLRHGDRGIVDAVVVTVDGEGNKFIRVKVRDLRIPEIGDKFASRHGQKGVVGLLVPQYDMPYTFDGVTPDLIINPHALPSRMTVGQLIESIAGKVGSLRGGLVDGTPFFGEKFDDLRRELLLYGYPQDGTEPMYDGRTGELISTPVFIGVVYYQRLHHMVADKLHSRSRGPVQLLTRQPTEGRAREGGLRFGEMERDAIIGHGAPVLLKERLLDSSDRYTVYVCEKCGLLGWFDRNKGRYVCPVHGDEGKLVPVEVSYAFKLLVQEMMSMLIYPKLVLRDRFSGD
ncbi:MAG: DNA-directed RNA polymerase subunit B [Zestosphaera sp.]